MIRLLKDNNPFNIVFLLLYAIALKVILFVHPPLINVMAWSEPLSRLTIYLLSKIGLTGNIPFSVLSILLLYGNALYFNMVLGNYKLNAKGVFLPALFMILLGSLMPGFCAFSSPLLGLIFLIMAMSKIFSLYKLERAGTVMFDAGFLISIATLFYFPYAVFLLFLLTGFIVARPFNLREYLIGISGVVIPYFLAGVVYYWNNSMLEFGLVFHKYLSGGFVHNFSSIQLSNMTPFIPILLLFLWSSLSIFNYYSKVVMQQRIIILILYIFFCAGTTSALLFVNTDLQHFIWLIVPVSFTMSIAVANQRRNWGGEMVHLCLILLLIYFQYFHKY